LSVTAGRILYVSEVTGSGPRTGPVRTHSIEIRDGSTHLKDNPDDLVKIVPVPDLS